ncbi:hypothetical protein BDY21DRAFT_337741 [Lineolata rhizophorae]|uniref:Uncharacterized protein n=1 Tax=Lineolata rhizophorae TaxID=578093 RepID=A0A6A6P9P0_9PEZI|nr:hypothetical protein BDY21DRAFT_337741 [Lineolata rhizophorae]
MAFSDDAENVTERSALVEHRARKESQWAISSLARFVGSGLFSPRTMTYDPIVLLLNAPSKEERDTLTARWRDNKLSELNFIGVVSALLAGCLTSTGSWPTILPNGAKTPWSVRCSWYCGIILALASILCTADQILRLHRLSAHREAMPHIRHLLSNRKRDAEGMIRPRRFQFFTWQLPVLFLTGSVVCMVVGMFVTVWAATSRPNGGPWWNENAWVAITFTIIAVFSALNFFLAQMSLFSPINELEMEGDD